MMNDDGSIILLILVVELSSPTFDVSTAALISPSYHVAFLTPLYFYQCPLFTQLLSGPTIGLHFFSSLYPTAGDTTGNTTPSELATKRGQGKAYHPKLFKLAEAVGRP
jgi:hypothetical protein